MTINIYMPALSPTMTEGSLSNWLVNVGDKVKAGDILAEIETDKATMEVEAVDEGIITKLVVKEGSSSIPVNSIIAILNGDDNSSKKEKNKNKKTKEIKNFKKKLTNHKELKNTLVDTVFTKNKELNKKNIASPYARNIAKQKNIDLKNISGSGPDGRIIKRDLEDSDTSSLFHKIDKDQLIEPSTMRKIIAERTTLTKKNVPHFYLTVESNVDKLLEMKKKINNTCDIKISINDILVKALAHAQKINPFTNIYWQNGKIIKNKSVDVSIAVALDEGLITPIIRNADKKGLKKISNEIKYLANKAKKGKLELHEYSGGTISISNLGMFGITEFSAIINPPQSSILAVGAIKKIPAVVDDEVKVINLLKSTLSADHRVLDGAIAGKLLKDFSDIIEEPYDLWLNSKDMEII